LSGYVLEYDAARKIAQGLGAHLDRMPSLVTVKGDTARLLPVIERAPALLGQEAKPALATKKDRVQQLSLFDLPNAPAGASTPLGEWSAPPPGATVLDRLHQSMLLFAAGRGDALKRFLVDDGTGTDPRFWRLAQALSALYPPASDEKRWVDGVLGRKKGLGL
jgi:hypothetical protein